MGEAFVKQPPLKQVFCVQQTQDEFRNFVWESLKQVLLRFHPFLFVTKIFSKNGEIHAEKLVHALQRILNERKVTRKSSSNELTCSSRYYTR